MSEAVGHRNLKSTTMVYILCALVYVGFALEISGFLVTDRKFQPLFRPPSVLDLLGGCDDSADRTLALYRLAGLVQGWQCG
jgi:hypothetical protein